MNVHSSEKTSGLKNVAIADIINGIPHGVAIIDSGNRILEMNRILEVITGHSSKSVRGQDGNAVLRSNITEELSGMLHSGNETVSLEGDVVRADRKKIPIRLSLTKIAGGGDKGAALLVMEDMSFIKDMGSRLSAGQHPKGIVGSSHKLLEIMDRLPVFANTDATLLITGETGTGKDLIAEAVHNQSARAGYPFIKVNCGALPENLLESELFGHVRGAFTGAHADKPGMFRMANGGTLFLTEIGDLPLSLQVKLLTVLDDREFYPLGSSKKIKVDVRIITGTHRDLRQLIYEGKFREDLFYRLNVLRAHMPSLRERGEDILLLAKHFMAEFCSPSASRGVKRMSDEFISFLKTYQYPGNVRELRNIIEHAANMCEGDTLMLNHLPSYVLSEPARAAESGNDAPARTAGRPTGWKEIEKKRLIEAMMSTGGNRTEAAKKLNWGRSTLWRKMRLYGLG